MHETSELAIMTGRGNNTDNDLLMTGNDFKLNKIGFNTFPTTMKVVLD